MISVYTGLYVQRLENGEVHSVQVKDISGNSQSLPKDQYIQKNIQPAIEELPSEDDYHSGKENSDSK